MVFNVCVNGTVQLLYISLNLLMKEILVMSFDHPTLITAVIIVGCQCITMVQNRYKFFNKLVN